MIVISYFILTALPGFISAAVSNVDFHLNENLIWTSMKKIIIKFVVEIQATLEIRCFLICWFIKDLHFFKVYVLMIIN